MLVNTATALDAFRTAEFARRGASPRVEDAAPPEGGVGSDHVMSRDGNGGNGRRVLGRDGSGGNAAPASPPGALGDRKAAAAGQEREAKAAGPSARPAHHGRHARRPGASGGSNEAAASDGNVEGAPPPKVGSDHVMSRDGNGGNGRRVLGRDGSGGNAAPASPPGALGDRKAAAAGQEREAKAAGPPARPARHGRHPRRPGASGGSNEAAASDGNVKGAPPPKGATVRPQRKIRPSAKQQREAPAPSGAPGGRDDEAPEPAGRGAAAPGGAPVRSPAAQKRRKAPTRTGTSGGPMTSPPAPPGGPMMTVPQRAHDARRGRRQRSGRRRPRPPAPLRGLVVRRRGRADRGPQPRSAASPAPLWGPRPEDQGRGRREPLTDPRGSPKSANARWLFL